MSQKNNTTSDLASTISTMIGMGSDIEKVIAELTGDGYEMDEITTALQELGYSQTDLDDAYSNMRTKAQQRRAEMQRLQDMYDQSVVDSNGYTEDTIPDERMAQDGVETDDNPVKPAQFDSWELTDEVNTFDEDAPVVGGRDFTTHFTNTSSQPIMREQPVYDPATDPNLTKNYMTNRKGEITGQAYIPAGQNYNTRQLYRKYKRGKVQGESFYDGRYHKEGGESMYQFGGSPSYFNADQFMRRLEGDGAYYSDPYSQYLPMNLFAGKSPVNILPFISETIGGFFGGQDRDGDGLMDGFFRDRKAKRNMQKDRWAAAFGDDRTDEEKVEDLKKYSRIDFDTESGDYTGYLTTFDPTRYLSKKKRLSDKQREVLDKGENLGSFLSRMGEDSETVRAILEHRKGLKSGDIPEGTTYGIDETGTESSYMDAESNPYYYDTMMGYNTLSGPAPSYDSADDLQIERLNYTPATSADPTLPYIYESDEAPASSTSTTPTSTSTSTMSGVVTGDDVMRLQQMYPDKFIDESKLTGFEKENAASENRLRALQLMQNSAENTIMINNPYAGGTGGILSSDSPNINSYIEYFADPRSQTGQIRFQDKGEVAFKDLLEAGSATVGTENFQDDDGYNLELVYPTTDMKRRPTRFGYDDYDKGYTEITKDDPRYKAIRKELKPVIKKEFKDQKLKEKFPIESMYSGKKTYKPSQEFLDRLAYQVENKGMDKMGDTDVLESIIKQELGLENFNPNYGLGTKEQFKIAKKLDHSPLWYAAKALQDQDALGVSMPKLQGGGGPFDIDLNALKQFIATYPDTNQLQEAFSTTGDYADYRGTGTAGTMSDNTDFSNMSNYANFTAIDESDNVADDSYNPYPLGPETREERKAARKQKRQERREERDGIVYNVRKKGNELIDKFMDSRFAEGLGKIGTAGVALANIGNAIGENARVAQAQENLKRYDTGMVWRDDNIGTDVQGGLQAGIMKGDTPTGFENYLNMEEGGETLNLSTDMIAKLIAAGADIEIK